MQTLVWYHWGTKMTRKMLFVKPPDPWKCTFDCANKRPYLNKTFNQTFKWTVNLLTKEIMMTAVMEVTALLCVKSFVLTHMLLFCLWLLAQIPAWLLLSGQGKCWVTWLEPQGLNLGVTGFLKAYWSAWMLECVAGCLCIAGCQLLCEITSAYGFVCVCVCARLCVFVYSCVCACSAELFDWRVWVLLQLAEVFSLFFLLGC